MSSDARLQAAADELFRMPPGACCPLWRIRHVLRALPYNEGLALSSFHVRWLVAMGFACACGAKAERLETLPQTIAPDAATDAGSEPRPRGEHVDIPRLRMVRFSQRPTWPLTRAPSLEPNYRVASPWFEACERRGRLRDDAFVYVQAWCHYRKDSQFDLISALVPLRSSLTPNLAKAVRFDLANLLAESKSGEASLAWLTALGGHDGDLFEATIAVYIDSGRIEEALVIAEHHMAEPSATCGRDLTYVTFLFDHTLSSIDGMARRHAGTACGERLRTFACMVATAKFAGIAQVKDEVLPECGGTVLDEDELAATRVIAARMRWIGGIVEPQEYVAIAELAASGLSVYDAEGIALSALEAALALSCTSEIVVAVQTIAARIQTLEFAQDRHDQRRSRLVEMTQARCNR
jgi:hypothetical protein